ncbi:MAG TPA: hemerythrin domain-containing protein [Candidatus Saccharimonadia bacterium]|nr:hemerythrin domain-containing protein [Candidatus Saccharimonadia bacterium]
MPLPEKPEELGNAGRPAAQTPHSGASVATLDPQAMHAVSLLTAEHRAVEAMFGAVNSGRDPELRLDTARRIAQALEIHMQVEEELFYPAVERATALDPEVRHARHEHDDIRARIGELTATGTDAGAFDTAIGALEACVAHHVREEEHDLFPRLDRVDADWTAIGVAMAARSEALRRAV